MKRQPGLKCEGSIVNLKPWQIVAVLVIVALGAFIALLVKRFKDGQSGR